MPLHRSELNEAAGQIIWDTQGMWKDAPQKVAQFIQNYTGQEQYNGNQYSSEWLFEFLKTKGVVYETLEKMWSALELKTEPAWFDRNAWSAYVTKALETKQPAEFLTPEK